MARICLVALVALFATQASDKPAARCVILITVDTLRADRLECYGYTRIKTPNINSLAQDGVLFENAIVQVPLTLPSHIVILTGTYPMYNRVRDFTGHGLPPEIPTLAEMLKRRGYSTAAFVSAFVLDSMWGLAKGFDYYFDNFDLSRYRGINPGLIERRAEQTIDHTLAWLKGNMGEKFFLWLHLFDPHSAYDPPEPFKTQYSLSPYDGEVAYVDQQLGRLFAFLKRNNLYDDSAILLLSDHGEGLGEHNESEHGFFVYDSTIKVPFILKLPSDYSQKGIRVKAQVSSIDVAPTILQICNFDEPKLQGRRLLSLILGKGKQTEEYAYSETFYPRNSFGWHELKALRTNRHKYIEAPRPELYDLERDPQELHNIYDRNRALANQLRQELARFEKRFSSQAARSGMAPNPETLDKLRSLGYVGFRAPTSRKSDQKLADPKDKVDLFNMMLKAIDYAELGDLIRSNALLEDFIRRDGQVYTAHYLLGLNHYRIGNFKLASEHFRRAVELNPEFESALFRLARSQHYLGRFDEAIAGYQRTLRLNPENVQARSNLAAAYLEKGQVSLAIEESRRIIELKPNLADGYRSLGIAYVQRRDYEKAIPQLEKAIALDPEDPMSLNYLGIAYRSSGRLKEAINAYKKAIKLKPDYAEAHLNLSFAYHTIGESEKAERELKLACKLKPQLCAGLRKQPN